LKAKRGSAFWLAPFSRNDVVELLVLLIVGMLDIQDEVGSTLCLACSDDG
jgi:hypothetical protein